MLTYSQYRERVSSQPENTALLNRIFHSTLNAAAVTFGRLRLHHLRWNGKFERERREREENLYTTDPIFKKEEKTATSLRFTRRNQEGKSRIIYYI